MEQKKKIRLSDIAEKLNVSIVTVSKALADKEGVGDDLRQQIKDLAEQMGYKLKKANIPSQTKGKVTGNIGILIPSKFFSDHYSYYWNVFNYLSTELLNRNYFSIMELLSDQDEQNLSLPRMIVDGKVDGLIILGQVSNEYLNLINNNYQKFILLDFYSNNNQFDSVSIDNYYCSYLLTSYVISQGHNKLKFVGNFNATTSISDRFMGFQKALLENSIPVSVSDIIDDRDEKGNEITMKLPEKNEMPTVFVCNNDETASRLMVQLSQEGYKIPDDISITGFDNYTSRHTPTVTLTTVYIRPEDIANLSADLIISKITGSSYIKGRHLVSGSLIIRDSVKKI